MQQRDNRGKCASQPHTQGDHEHVWRIMNRLARRPTQVHQHRLPPELVTPFISELPDKFCFTPVRAHSNSRVLVSVSLRVFCDCAHSAGFTRHRRSAWRKGGGPLLPLPSLPLLRATSTLHPQHPFPDQLETPPQKRGPHAPIPRGPLCNHAQPRPLKPLANGGHLQSNTARRSS